MKLREPVPRKWKKLINFAAFESGQIIQSPNPKHKYFSNGWSPIQSSNLKYTVAVVSYIGTSIKRFYNRLHSHPVYPGGTK